MKLSKLLILADLPPLKTAGNDSEISDITSDSRSVLPGSLYVAVRGESIDGHQFIEEALEKGAVAVVCEKKNSALKNESRLLQVPDTKIALGMLSSAFQGFPSKELLVLGVTGTSGKTTTAYLLESILKAAGKSVGLIGTVEFRMNGKVIPSTHTTPGAVELQRLLREMKDAGCDSVVMEVSSHALKQHRSTGVFFDGACFTNLTPEHLDYHPNMEDYFNSKKLLFTEEFSRSRKNKKSPQAAILVGSEWGDKIAKDLKDSLGKNLSEISLSETIRVSARGIQGEFSGISLTSKLIGKFNAENIAVAVGLAKKIGLPDTFIKKGIEDLENIPGRMEGVIDLKKERIILVDYAHKPDALEKAIQVLRDLREPGKKITTVFGCGGDRDKTKRPKMGEIACRLSDRVVITSDNPRSEDPNSILREIIPGTAGYSNFQIELDREKAITLAVQSAGAGDIVLIAGKGHEDYQIIGTKKIHFDDREVAKAAL